MVMMIFIFIFGDHGGDHNGDGDDESVEKDD